MRSLFLLRPLCLVVFQLSAFGVTPLPPPPWRVDAALQALDDPCLETQYAAVRYLTGKNVSDARFAIKLISLLEDPQWEQYRASVFSAMGSTGTNQVLCVKPMMKFIDSQDKYVRIQVINALCQMPLNEDQATEVCKRLFDSDEDVRVHTINSITNLGDGRFLKLIAKVAATNFDSQFQMAALNVIADNPKNGFSCCPEIVKILKSPDSSVRNQAIETLGKFQTAENEYTRSVISSLEDQDGHVRYKAVAALGRLDFISMEVALALKQTFENQEENWDTRLLAMSVYCRGAMGEDFAIENSRGLVDPSAITRANCLVVLEQTGQAGARFAPLVLQLLRDTNHLVRQHAIDTLFAFDVHSNRYAGDIATLLDDQDIGVRFEALAILRKMNGGVQGVNDKLLRIMANENYIPRTQILDLLATSPRPADTASTVSRYLTDSDPLIRIEAVRLLVSMGTNGNAYASQISNLATNPIESVRIAALNGISELVGRGVPCPWKIEKLLESSDLRQKLIAIAALKQTHSVTNADKLAILVEDSDQNVASAAAKALAEMGEVVRYTPQLTSWMLKLGRSDFPIDTFAPTLEQIDSKLPEDFLFVSFELVHSGTKREEGRNRLWGCP